MKSILINTKTIFIFDGGQCGWSRETKEKGEKFIKDNEYTFPVYFDLDYDATITYQAYSLPNHLY